MYIKHNVIYSRAFFGSKLLGESPACPYVLGQDPNRDFEFDKPTSVTFFFSYFPPFIKDQMPHWQAGNCFNVIMMSSDLRCISHQRGKEGEGEVRKMIWRKGENKGKRERK